VSLLVASLFVLAGSTAVYCQQKDGGVKGHYQNIEVGNFDVQEGVTFPPENIKPMMDEIVSKLNGLKKFAQVTRAGETQTSADAPMIQLIGTVTKYEPGSRAKRYIISMGAGKTRVVTHVKFIDKASGKILYETDASGAVSWGLFGGDSKSSLSGVGKKIAEITKHEFF
jgi:hypothetical protein